MRPKTYYMRCLKRKFSVFHDSSPDDFIRMEFRAREGGRDMRPSVYLTGDDRSLQTRAEHTTLIKDPPKSASSLAIATCPPGASEADTPGATGFDQADQAHREFVFESPHALNTFAGHIFDACQGTGAMQLSHSRQSIVSYAAGRVRAEDPEWVRWVNAHRQSDKKQWVKRIDAEVKSP